MSSKLPEHRIRDPRIEPRTRPLHFRAVDITFQNLVPESGAAAISADHTQAVHRGVGRRSFASMAVTALAFVMLWTSISTKAFIFLSPSRAFLGRLPGPHESTRPAVIETVPVKPDGKPVFRFANGTEIIK